MALYRLRAALCLAVWLSAVASLSWAAPSSDCPPEGAGEDQVFLPSNTSCVEFYLCAHGVPHLLVCPSGLYFNPDTNQCDYRSNVNCTVPEPTTTSPSYTAEPASSTSVPAGPTAEPEGSITVRPSPTSVPPSSTSGSPIPSTAEPSPVLLRRLLSVPSSQDEDQSSPDDDPVCPETDSKYPVLVPNPANCSTYFVCSGGAAVLRPCPAGLFFNNATWTCDYAANVDCPESDVSLETAEDGDFLVLRTMSVDTEDNDRCPEVDGQNPVFLPDPEDCGSFYMCSHGVAYLEHCPDDLLFNNDTWNCDFPENVHCNQTNTSWTGEALWGDDELPDACPSVDGDDPVLFPDPANCSTFYMCSNGVPYLRPCPPGLLFNNDTQSCDFAQNVACSQTDDVSIMQLQSDQSDVVEGCPEVDGDFPVLLPNPSNCSTFFMCSHGVPYPKSCPAGLLFNNDTWSCDYPKNAHCNATNEETEEDLELVLIELGATGGCPEVDGKYPVLMPNPANCSTFFMCSHGSPYLHVCSDGLMFNNNTWTCDYPENVSC